MTHKELVKLLDFLKKGDYLDDEQYADILKQKFSTFKDAETFIRGVVKIPDEDWTQAKGVFYNIDYINLVGQDIKEEVLNILPQDLAVNYQVIVFEKEGSDIKVGLVDPTNFKAIEAINYLARKQDFKVKYHLISNDSYASASKQYETMSEQVGEAMASATEMFAPQETGSILDDDQKNIDEVVKSAPVSKIVSVILRHAIEGRASDIHIEPVAEQSKVRYRIDGVLHTTIVLPIYVHAALVSRIKVMANLKIDETRVPQDGRIRINVGKKDVDFRVSTIPLMGNEKVVMRILKTPDKAPSFEDLGFMGLNLKNAMDNIKKPNGMFLLTGPTGSGKSTTLFAALNYLNKEDVNIATLEDPVEYSIVGANQSQVRSEIGFTFAAGLRSLLRQDPDIIMVGEVRDNETAELSIHAGLTGHSVLTTLHTNSALGAIPRLIDMEVEPFLLANTLNLVVAQRLVRRVCPKCRVEYELPKDMIKLVKEKLKTIPPEANYADVDMENLKFYKGKGCLRCNQSGYKGRLSILETINITENFRKIIAEGFKTSEVEAELKSQHFMNIEQDGVLKALLGLTTVDEIVRVSKM